MTDWLTPPSSPTTPPHTLLPSTPRRKVVPINPPGYVSPAMARNTEPAGPAERKDQHLPPKSYADAAEEAMERDSDDVFDEAAIKETPPPSSLPRNHSEPRPLGEVIDEDDRSLPPNSPTLRHVIGRLEKNGHTVHQYADAVKSAEPTSPHVDEQNGPSKSDAKKETDSTAAPGADTQNGHSYAEAVKDVEPTSPHVDEQNGNPMGKDAPTSYSGVGRDDTPRSPTPKKAHKRISSRSLNGTANKQAQQPSSNDGVMDYQRQWQNGSTPTKADDSVSGSGIVFEEKYRSKSGHNLVTAEADENLITPSLQQREDKDITTEPNATPKRQRKNSELVSGRRAGAGWSNSAIRWAPANVPLQRRLQTLMVLGHTLSIAGGLALFFLLCTIPLLWPILVPYLLYVLLSNAGTSGELSHRSEYMRNSRIWSLFGSYFPARMHRSVPLEPTRKYIFGYHPHGIISHGAFAAFATEALGFSQLFPGITNTLLTLDANFRIPLYRDYALRMGLASVSRESCENILSKGGRNGEGMGRAITIVVGGARESLDAKPGSLKLVLKKRKGFVKLAIRQGADLVPTLAFGENDLYEQFDSNGHPYVHKAQLLVKKFAGFTVPLFHARGKVTTDQKTKIHRPSLHLN